MKQHDTAIKPPAIDPYQHKQLFLDDHAIESTSGLERVLHQPEKAGPVLTPDRSCGQISLQSRSVPQWNPEKGLWEWWYWGSYAVPPHGPYHSTAISLVHYATSPDGVSWETPKLGLHEWRGSKENNVAVDPETGHRSLYHIIRDEADDNPARRYKGLFGSSGRQPAVSPDGFEWDLLDSPSIPSSDESHFTYDENSGQYLAFVKRGTKWGRSVWLSASSDFVSWTEPRLILHSDEVDKENRRRRVREAVESPEHLSPPLVDDGDYIGEVYQMAVMPYEGLYVGFPGLFNPAGAIPPPQTNHTGLNQVELTVSRDLHHWSRVAERRLFIGISPWDGQAYDTAQCLLAGRPIVRDGEIWIYYNACRFRGHKELYPEEYAPYFEDTSALALAKLRLDGFVSLDTETLGILQTKPFALGGGNLHVNLDAPGGEVSAEVVDADTLEPLAGLSTEECAAVSGDHLDAPVRWGDTGLPSVDQPVRIRFVLRKARLFAFWMDS